MDNELITLVVPGVLGALVAGAWPYLSSVAKSRNEQEISSTEIDFKREANIADREAQMREELRDDLNRVTERLKGVELAEEQCQEDRDLLRIEVNKIKRELEARMPRTGNEIRGGADDERKQTG